MPCVYLRVAHSSSFYPSTPSTTSVRVDSSALLLRGTIVNRTYGTRKNLPGIYLPIFTNNIWSYLMRSPVIVEMQQVLKSQNYATEILKYIHCFAVNRVGNPMPCHHTGYDMDDIHTHFYKKLFICLLTICRALFIQNEKADIIHRIPLTPSNQCFFPACTYLNMHPHHLHTHSINYRGQEETNKRKKGAYTSAYYLAV